MLKEHQLYANFSKFGFWLSKIHFLGHMASAEGILVDHAKIEAVKDWKAPRSVMEIRRFHGLAGCYKRFIEGFYKIAAPLIALT